MKPRIRNATIGGILLAILVIIGWVCCSADAAPMLTVSSACSVSDRLFISSAPDIDSPCIYVNTTEPVTISNCSFSTPGYGIITCAGANVTIDNDSFVYTGAPYFVGNVGSKLVYICDSRHASITHSRFDGPTVGVLVVGGTGGGVVALNIFHDNFCAVQLAGVTEAGWDIYWNQVDQPALYEHNDQISLYESSGHSVFRNFVAFNPDGPQALYSAGINIGDKNSSHNSATYNTVINGAGSAISVYYANGNSSTVAYNTVVGIGYSVWYSSGISMLPDTGYCYGNVSGFWDTMSKKLLDYASRPGIADGNTSLDQSSITLAAEEGLYTAWIDVIVQSKEYVGPYWMRNDGVTYPKATDFPQ
jgi:Right handed beta helix region